MIKLRRAMVCVLLVVATSTQGAQVSPNVHRLMVSVEALIEKEHENQAIALMDQFLAQNRPSPYEQSMLNRLFAVVYANTENYAKAAVYFERVLDAGLLDSQVLRQTRQNLAYLYLQERRFEEVQRLMRDIIRQSNELLPQEAYVIAFAYFELEEKELAVEWAHRLLRLLDLEQVTQRHYYDLIIGIYLNDQMYAEAKTLLERMLERYPEEERYWRQLIAVEIESNNPSAALALMELSLSSGLLKTDRDKEQLASLYLQQGIPYKAAHIAQSLVTKKVADAKLHELLGMAWWEAREYDKAIPHLQQVASTASDGRLFLQLAYLYVEREAWSDAVEAIDLALKKQKVQNRPRLQLLRGIARFNLGKMKAAEADFLQCLAFKTTSKQATQWLEFMRSSQSDLMEMPAEMPNGNTNGSTQ
ncbi:MAG: tetratricopeptide repeat protein [Candidatus Oxydemutatoraceae bacterium WSBS_2016_MAG_OTU14]